MCSFGENSEKPSYKLENVVTTLTVSSINTDTNFQFFTVDNMLDRKVTKINFQIRFPKISEKNLQLSSYLPCFNMS